METGRPAALQESALIFEKGIENEQIERSNKDNIWSFQTKVVKEIQFSTWVVNKSFQEKTTKQNDIAIFKQSKIKRTKKFKLQRA